jgi:uncharacterized membrane protein
MIWSKSVFTADEKAVFAAWQIMKAEIQIMSRELIQSMAWNAALASIQQTRGNSISWYSAWDAISCFIAYDDCAYILDSAIDEIKLLAILGDTKAMCLLQACIVFSEEMS